MAKTNTKAEQPPTTWEIARGKAAPVIADAREKAAPVIAEVRVKTAPVIADAREKAAPLLIDARDMVAPVIAEARDKAAPVVSDAREKLATDVLPVITAAIAAANEATGDVREEALKRGKAAAEALKGTPDPPKKHSHKLRNLLIVVALGAVIAFVAKKLSSRNAETAWQSSYTPSTTSTTTSTGTVDETPTATAAAAATGTPLSTAAEQAANDEAAAAPDEAASDAADVPHVSTTPDDPAEEIHLRTE